MAEPGGNPFAVLPFPSPGDRIKADDFKTLSQSLRLIHDTYVLSSALFGHNFGDAKVALAAQQYEIKRVMSVFGTEIDNLADTSLDARKVIHIMPVTLGERGVLVILTEAVETRRFTPNLLGLTYQEASERLHVMLGDVTFPSMPVHAMQLVGLSLAQASDALARET